MTPAAPVAAIDVLADVEAAAARQAMLETGTGIASPDPRIAPRSRASSMMRFAGRRRRPGSWARKPARRSPWHVEAAAWDGARGHRSVVLGGALCTRAAVGGRARAPRVRTARGRTASRRGRFPGLDRTVTAVDIRRRLVPELRRSPRARWICGSTRSRRARARKFTTRSRISAPSRHRIRLGARIRPSEDGRGPAVQAEPEFLKGRIEIQDEGSSSPPCCPASRRASRSSIFAPVAAARRSRWRR